MFQKYSKNFSNDAKKLIKNGYCVFKIENLDLLNNIRDEFKTFLSEEKNITTKDLSRLHNDLEPKNVNDARVGFYNKINEGENFTEQFLKLGENQIFEAVGTELAGNKKVNFSIQLPDDESSTLGIHCDTFSGESEFQINLWVPLTDCKNSNSMFFFNPKFSKKVIDNLEKYEKNGIDSLLSSHKEEYEYINIKYGQGLVFTPTCLHGNKINKTKTTRISFNCRYKNIFSPYASKEENEKRLGSFYKILTPKASTIIGFNTQIKY